MREFRTVAVVGAGTMGSAIAQHFLMKGLTVRLADAAAEGLARGQRLIEASLDEALARRLLDAPARAATLARLHPTLALADLADADLVVEAVFEDLALKRELLGQLENVVAPDCVLASNTSSFQVSDIAAALAHPQRLFGTHYFYHAAKNKLIELIPGERSDPELLRELEGFYAELGKTPILTADAPGFAVNRFFVPWLNEAVRLYEEGLGGIPGIDAVARATFGVGMGPFALMNATGVPIARHAAAGLAARLGPFYAPAGTLCRQVERGGDWDLDDDRVAAGGTERPEAIRRRLLAAALGCAAALVSEGVCDATATDLGARTGLRWPRGPFELTAALGRDVVAGMVGELFEAWHLPLPAMPFAQAGELALAWVQVEVHGNTGLIVFNLPDRMNALGEAVMEQLEAAWARLEDDPAVQRVFFCGRGKAFVAGADIRFFLDAIDAGDLDRIQAFTERGQRLLGRIEAAAKPTCAFLDGLALGGGLELALACRYRLGTRNTSIALPETGIGIYPGLGGTQRSSRLLGPGVAKFLIATGHRIDAARALQLGLIDAVTDPLRHLRELAALPLPAPQAGRRPQPELEQAFAGYRGELDATTLARPELAPFARELSRKAPLALATAMRLVDEGLALDLPAGLALELAGLKTIFASDDARTGLASVLDASRPQYLGH
ncbi:MAG: 3-hydroxyacyl-CoA dehydrogenase/enoyl-CoA hydratase family protein [Xanthomonadaceae bacterium]|nr:3-hydroxyacyl-CoA dehydrogenase/enoyl-CoA hydratase family protein [Xanthomonadaceae bacterium]MDE3071108.1 3-hydroxyacyl-CoA dehydrogenase/enoyl-CoA hydratase family protein [Pseudomonadota bacterium]